jgi:D-alanyl-D-alanine carboxypeptidase (penicillin-binding protein 5/6)
MNFIKQLPIFLILLLLHFVPLSALESGPELLASSAILYDYTTGRVLFEKEADAVIAPASMTKLVTLYLAWQSLEEGRVSRDDLVEITSEGSSFSRPSGSSLMLLEEGQHVTFLDIMKGLAISSGNDAAYALAHYLSGSEAIFVSQMNDLVSSMGLNEMYFEDPDGWSSHNRITAREYALFSADYIRSFPYALQEIHSQEYFVYPKEENLPADNARIVTARRKKNTNILLGKVPGVDGLKTGYIDESGFNFTATAKRGASRYIAVILGIKDIPYFEGITIRAKEAEELLEYGFRNFKTIFPVIPSVDPLSVWEGQENFLEVQLDAVPQFTLSLDEMDSFTSIMEMPDDVTAPIAEGDAVGRLIYKIDGKEVGVFNFRAIQSIEKANIFKTLWHKIKKQYIHFTAP